MKTITDIIMKAKIPKTKSLVKLMHLEKYCNIGNLYGTFFYPLQPFTP